MLIDKVRVDFVAGAGGPGSVHFEKSGKPDGGDGGNGGDIILVGDRNCYDLKKFNSQKKFEAEDALRGALNKRTGANGEDLYVKVPLITRVYDLSSNLIATVTKDKEEVVIAKGGTGGRGNFYYRRGQVETLKKFTPGKPGDKIQGFLQLELVTDIILLGLPNAGKSSMLNVLTNSNTKVADYPFTTLSPSLGMFDGVILMDLPGLIEGTAEGRGLGSGFSKHIKHTKAVAHFLSLESQNLKGDYDVIREELTKISPELVDKPELLVLTKSDMISETELKAKMKEVQKFHRNFTAVTILDDNKVEELIVKLKSII